VDRLELRMSDCGLCHRRQGVVIAESDEVLYEPRDILRWGRDEGCAARVVAAASDPVLLVPELAPFPLEPGTRQKTSMNFEDELHAELPAGWNLVDGEHHCLDVPQHLDGGHVGGALAQRSLDLGPKETTGTDLQALDPRGGDRLSSEQDPRQ
jgi:hypothetical protein